MKKSKSSKDDRIEEQIDLENLPKHIAIIMDGNGRWAKNRFLPRTAGHITGAEKVRDAVEACLDLKVPFLTLYAFSKENWKRPKKEVETLMQLLSKYLKKETAELDKNGVKINIIGDIEELPDSVKLELKKSIEKTKDNTSLTFNLALNYGSRQEIVKAFKDMHIDIEQGKLDIADVDESTVSDYLYTKGQPDPDLIIRTSGEERISNFLLYQIAYSEFDFIDVLWPDFKKDDLYKSIIKFQKRSRRYGGI